MINWPPKAIASLQTGVLPFAVGWLGPILAEINQSDHCHCQHKPLEKTTITILDSVSYAAQTFT